VQLTAIADKITHQKLQSYIVMQNIKWSYSGLKDFVNCPKQYQEVKVLKNFIKYPTKETTYGNVVHKALENYVKDGTPLEKNYEMYQSQVDPLREMEGEKYPEHHMAIDYDRNPCSYGSKEYWVRGIADLLVVNEEQGFIVDYKTGSNKYADTRQLQLMALMAFAHFPQLDNIRAGLLFVAHKHFITEEYDREDINDLWGNFERDLTRLSHAYDSDVWQANPTALCGYCPVRTCEFHRGR